MKASFIPIVDLSKDSDEYQAQAVRDALSTVGFLAVKGADIDPVDVNAVFSNAKTFFQLPMEEKDSYRDDKTGIGYSKLRTQALGDGKIDHKEAFSYGKYCAKHDQPMPPPYSEDKDALDAMKRFYDACHDVSQRLLSLFALALDLPSDHFRQHHSWGLKTAYSQIHYPALTSDQRKQISDLDIRAGEHKDWGTLTMLFQEPKGQPGLQVYLPSSLAASSTSSSSSVQSSLKQEGPKLSGYSSNIPGWEWFDAPLLEEPGSFLVNVGLAMELWSSGAYRATLHRVIFPGSKEAEEIGGEEGLKDRYSIAFFVQPDDDVQLQPVLPGGVIDTSKQAITSGELFRMKLEETHARVKGIPKSHLVQTAQAVEAR